MKPVVFIFVLLFSPSIFCQINVFGPSSNNLFIGYDNTFELPLKQERNKHNLWIGDSSIANIYRQNNQLIIQPKKPSKVAHVYLVNRKNDTLETHTFQVHNLAPPELLLNLTPENGQTTIDNHFVLTMKYPEEVKNCFRLLETEVWANGEKLIIFHGNSSDEAALLINDVKKRANHSVITIHIETKIGCPSCVSRRKSATYFY